MTRDRARRYFAEQLVKYREIDCWWSDGRLVTRCLATQFRYPVPPCAIYVGRYAHPFDSITFLTDLDDAITRIRRQSRF